MKIKIQFTHTPKILCYSILLLFCNVVLAQTENNAQSLENIHVKATNPQSPTVERKSQGTIEKEMVRDSFDLVRYLVDVGVGDDGRRLKGFAIRGVEDNRVGISIDGIALSASEENSLYARYGNFNNSRVNVDTELVRSIEIGKGADSFTAGSGALGGYVNYRTLNANDLVQAGKTFGGKIKSGYATKNREWVNTAGLGFQTEQLDGAFLLSHRRGHETKSNTGKMDLYRRSSYETDYYVNRRAEIGNARIKPDPSAHRNNSYLAKLGWQITPEHRVGVSVTQQNNLNQIKEHSYALTTYWREADDKQKRTNTNLYYEWTPKKTAVDMVRVDVDHQKIENGVINYKGNHVRQGNWQTGYTEEREFMRDKDFRNNVTQLQRLTIRTDSQPIQVGRTQHQLSAKIFGEKRKFENRNTDLDLDKNGNVVASSHYTIQYPMKTTQYGVALSDKFTLNPRWSGYVALRYDDEQVKPQDSSLPCGDKASFGRLCTNVDKNGTKFRNWSGSLGLDWQLNDVWKVGYQAATGYRVPTASELYFTFESPYGNWLANPNLKAERALNQTLSLQGRGTKGNLGINLYQTRYKNFLFEQESTMTREDKTCDWYAQYYTGCTGSRTDYFQQMVNLDRAKVRGLEINGQWKLPRNFTVSGSVGYSKGQLSGEPQVSLLSIQPLKMVLGLDYQSPNDKWGVFSRLTLTGAKKAKDAQIAEQVKACRSYQYDYWTGQQTCAKGAEYYKTEVLDFRWLNQKAWVFDAFGYYRPSKNLTLRAGVYNLFNTRYHTWDSLRGINARSTINSLSVSDTALAQQGLARYYAPPRNYAVSLEYRF